MITRHLIRNSVQSHFLYVYLLKGVYSRPKHQTKSAEAGQAKRETSETEGGVRAKMTCWKENDDSAKFLEKTQSIKKTKRLTGE